MADGQTSPTKYILIGCGIALALGVCGVGSCLALAGGGVWYAVEKTEAPAAEARAFLHAIAKSDVEGALIHASTGYKGRVNAERLRAVIAARPLKDITDITFAGRSLRTDGADLSGVIATQGGEVGVEVTMVQEGELWRVETIRLAGEPLE